MFLAAELQSIAHSPAGRNTAEKLYQAGVRLTRRRSRSPQKCFGELFGRHLQVMELVTPFARRPLAKFQEETSIGRRLAVERRLLTIHLRLAPEHRVRLKRPAFRKVQHPADDLLPLVGSHINDRQ